MKIEANDKAIQDIFSLGYFIIPRFQRPYSWGSEEVGSFWNDVIEKQSDNYFIGSMVVYQEKKRYFGIVDGQQRLTTITLMLAAIRNAFIKVGEPDLAKGLHSFIEKANIDNQNEFLLKSEASHPYLQNNIQSFEKFDIKFNVGDKERSLENAFNLINGKIRQAVPQLDGCQPLPLFPDIKHDTAVDILKKFRDKVLSLKLVFIQLDNENDAYLIFETLNARGRDLTTSDLVKNLILKNIKGTNVSLDQAKESWKEMIGTFESSGDTNALDNFLVHYWCSKFNYCTDKKLYSEVTNKVADSPDAAKILLADLGINASYYSSLIRPEDVNWSKEESAIKSSLKALNLFKVKQQTAMTLALLRSYRDKKITLKKLQKILLKIEAFHYCFNAITSQRSSGSIASNYSKFAISLNAAKKVKDIEVVINDLTDFLISKLPDEEEFVVKFCELKYASNDTKDKSIVKYTLSKLFPLINAGLTIDFDALTIEHIFPECDFKLNPALKISSIGNLILLDTKTNSEDMGSKRPEEKFNILADINYPLAKVLVEPDSWDKDQISNRATRMAKIIYANSRAKIQ